VIDISERKQGEALRASEVLEFQRVSGLLDTLLRIAPIGFCFVDRDLRYVRINERLAAMNGVSVEAHLGRHVSEIVPALGETAREVTNRILATGEAVLNHEFSGETPDAPGVTRFWSESWYPVPDGAGGVLGFGVIVEDITARKQTEDALRESEQFTRRVLDNNLAAFVGVLTVDGTVTYANPAPLEAAGIPASEVLGKKFWDCYWWSYSREIQTQLREACERAASGEIVRYDVAVRMAGDARMWIDFQVAPLRDAEGRITHLIPSAMDISVRIAAEEKLVENESNLQRLLDTAHEGIWMLDLAGKTTYVNARMAEALGRTPDEMVGHDAFEFVWHEDVPSGQSEFELRRADSTGRESDFRYSHKNGSAVWFQVNSNPILDAEGRSTGFLGMFSDITARRQTEAALRASERNMRSVADNSPDILTRFDPELRHVFVSAAIERKTGRPSAEFIGKTNRELGMPDHLCKVWDAALRSVLDGGRQQSLDFAFEGPNDCRQYAALLVPEFGEDGVTVESVLGVTRDVTDARAAEAEVREAEERLRLATDATAVGIWQWHVPTGAIRWDAQMFRIYGIAPTPDGSVHQTYWRGAVLPEDLAESERILQDTVRRRGQSRRDFRIQRSHDGEVRDIESAETVRTNAQGETEWVVGTNLDVTDRRDAERKLRQLAADLTESDRRKDEFLTTLAHELRNPLAPLRTGLDVMRMSPSGTPAVERARAMMERQLGHMVRLVDDLMDVSRINRGKVALQVARVQARAVIDHAVEASRPLVEADGHALVVDAGSESAWVDGDLTRLAQAVSNLVNNAAKYTPQGGRIELAARVEAGEVVITVSDNGAGISAEMLPHVFDLFTQVDRTLDRAQGGLGVGLSVVRKLVELHHGTATAASPGLGLGSTFTVRLPLAATANEAAQVDKPSDTRVSVSLRVLVVDDNVDAAEMLSEMLELAGHEARAVHDGPAALAAARDVRPDVVFLDIGLPGMNGHEVARQFRADAAFAGIVLVALTGWGSNEDKRRSREAGFDHHVTKPLDFKRVQEIFEGINRREVTALAQV